MFINTISKITPFFIYIQSRIIWKIKEKKPLEI